MRLRNIANPQLQKLRNEEAIYAAAAVYTAAAVYRARGHIYIYIYIYGGRIEGSGRIYDCD